MSLFIVNTTSSPLRAEPAHEAEQISRLLLGESFRVHERSEDQRWALGLGPDGYQGWLRAWHLTEVDVWPAAQLCVTQRWSHAYERPDSRSQILLDLSFATRLRPGGSEVDGFIPWQLPGGAEVWTPVQDLEPLGGDMETLLTRGLRLLAIPYEWGGRSSAGLDCSGFVQLLFSTLGQSLPRDAWQQAEHGQALSLSDPRLWQRGDLLFFGAERIDHVGLWMGEDRLLHASGRVQVEGLAPRGKLIGSHRPALAALRRLNLGQE
ncbi:C40 family peptidase [bacterium]|nr:C40 family peptidase [bacterium]